MNELTREIFAHPKWMNLSLEDRKVVAQALIAYYGFRGWGTPAFLSSISDDWDAKEKAFNLLQSAGIIRRKFHPGDVISDPEWVEEIIK